MEHPEAKGLWQFDHDDMTPTTEAEPLNDAFTFLVDADTVVVRLLAMFPARPLADDDFYRLESRWEGDRLRYRLPTGQWVTLAAWRDDHFEAVAADRIRHFKRVQPEAVVSWNRAILKPDRPRFDYEAARRGPAGGQP